MTYQVPASKRSIKQNRFEFKIPGDRKTYSVPKAQYLTVGQVEAMSSNTEQVNMADLLILFDEPEAAAAARLLDTEQLEALMAAWQEDSGLSVGESSASAPTS